MQRSSPAASYARLVGFGLSIAGVLGFFYSASFSSGSVVPTADVLGLFAVNGWHNLLSIVAGLLGLAAAGSPKLARRYALGVGGLYVAIAIWGFILGASGTIAELIPINTADNLLHGIIGVLGLAAAISTPGATPGPAADRARSFPPAPEKSEP